MSSARADQANNHRVIQVVVALYSFIFFGVIAYGYFYLFVKNSIAAAYVVAVIAATLAWFLAKFIGSNEGGIRAHLPMFLLLLAISAAGVYNSAMLYWEGSRILAETSSESQDRFGNMQTAAEQALADTGVKKHRDNVDRISEQLYREMENPRNCGEGPEARKLIRELLQELPEFKELSGTGRNCSLVPQIIKQYRDQISDLTAKASWNDTGLIGIADAAKQAREELGQLHGQTTTQYSPAVLKDVLAQLEALDDQYRQLRYNLARRAKIDKLPTSLDLSEVKNLGDATKLPALIIERLDVLSTYVYLFLALSFDWLMVYLFTQARRNRFNRPAPVNTGQGAW
jgi:hypothetical protein